MTLEHVGAFLCGAGVALIVVALLDRHSLLTRRKWRDHPSRRAGIIKDWNE